MNFEELREIASKKIKPKDISSFVSVGGVAAALLTENGNVYTGVCIDTACSLGFCAEHAAIASMITNQEYKIKKIVAVNTEGNPIPPCGRCRELISQISEESSNVEILIGMDNVLRLSELLPNDWKIKDL